MADSPLAEKVALVTGAASGIGRATALALAEAGAKVVVNDYGDEDAAGSAVETIERNGGAAFAHQGDVGDEDAVKEMFARLTERYGTLHILVNNAGIQKDAGTLDMSVADWQSVIRTNLQGQFLCAREAARVFCRRGSENKNGGAIGSMVFMSSVHDQIPWAGHANYAASKGGVVMLMKSLAQEFGPHKIRVNAVSPGAIKTGINKDVWENEARQDELHKLIPYGRLGEPEDVAKAVVWLASDASDYVHGHVLYIDGGMMLYPGFREGG